MSARHAAAPVSADRPVRQSRHQARPGPGFAVGPSGRRLAHRYGQYLGKHGRFEESLGHTARVIDLLGALGERLQQAIVMTYGGRCYGCRAGRLDESLDYARRAYEAGDALDDARLRALRAMEAEPHMYKGDWY